MSRPVPPTKKIQWFLDSLARFDRATANQLEERRVAYEANLARLRAARATKRVAYIEWALAPWADAEAKLEAGFAAHLADHPGLRSDAIAELRASIDAQKAAIAEFRARLREPAEMAS